MSKLSEIREKIQNYEKAKLEHEKQLTNVDAGTRHELILFNAPRLNFLARETIELILESGLLSIIEEKDKALEFYADGDKYEEQFVAQVRDWYSPEILSDKGKVALAALKSTKEE